MARRRRITLYEHGGKIEQIPIPLAASGHGAGDAGIMADFVRTLPGESEPLTNARASLESHLLAFAAEEARRQGSVIDRGIFRERAEQLS